MTAITVQTNAEIRSLSQEDTESLAQAVLEWPEGPARHTFNNAGVAVSHSDYKTEGYPYEWEGYYLDSRRDYLRRRLQQRRGMTNDGILRNEEAQAVYDAEIQERASKPQTFVEVAVKAALGERIPNYSDRPHKINFVDLGDGLLALSRSDDSVGREICQEKVFVKKDALASAIKALHDSRDFLLSQGGPDLSSVDGIELIVPQAVQGIRVQATNQQDTVPSRDNSNSPLTFDWDKTNEGHLFMSVQSWKFRFHAEDFKTVLDSVNTRWVATPAPAE